ncbi:AraC family transcriptional regulator [Colwellia piezophila]|uniref:AraC family transcriptional regulator n=1 Tax=Colwellia piezophila TaxID=211668 RepID=UPI000361A7ED|nr:AraC family transcriptional regulator [Colwellia piezophila]
MKLGDVSSTYIDVMLKVIKALGCNCDDILQQFSISQAMLCSPDARISIPKFMRLGHACIKKSQNPCLGLLMGRATAATHLGYAGLLALSAKDLYQACHQIARYEPLSTYNVRGQSQFYLSDDNSGIMAFYSLAPYNDYNYFVVDSLLSSWYQLLQSLSASTDVVEKVCFEFSPPSYVEEYEEFFDCDVLFNQTKNYLVIKKEALKLPCQSNCAATFELLKRQADSNLEKMELGLTFQEKVSQVIGPLLANSNLSHNHSKNKLDNNTPTLAQVAEQLNMAPWTVRRKLVTEGSSFQQTLNNTRKDLSISYIKDTALTLGEVAYLIGFSSPAAFQRAFKRWTGEAPGQFRLRG